MCEHAYLVLQECKYCVLTTKLVTFRVLVNCNNYDHISFPPYPCLTLSILCFILLHKSFSISTFLPSPFPSSLSFLLTFIPSPFPSLSSILLFLPSTFHKFSFLLPFLPSPFPSFSLSSILLFCPSPFSSCIYISQHLMQPFPTPSLHPYTPFLCSHTLPICLTTYIPLSPTVLTPHPPCLPLPYFLPSTPSQPPSLSVCPMCKLPLQTTNSTHE